MTLQKSRPVSVLAAVAAAFSLVVVAACSPSVGEYNALLRGDRAFAGGQMDEALAEYRLAVLQGSESPEVYARLAHTYAVMGRVDEAADNYARAAAQDSMWSDQAVADLVRLGRQAAERNDLYGVASAMQRAIEFRPGLTVSDLALPLARHYARNGEPGRALPFFQRAMAAVPPDSAPEIMYETAIAYEAVGDCGRAAVFFEQYRETIPRWQRTEVNWHLGNCSFQHARSLFREGRLETAIRHLDVALEIGEPRSVVGQAWFQKGEILSLMGACAEALDAYREVARADVAGSGALVSRAQARIDEIRFGGFRDSFALEQRCGLPEPEFERSPIPDSLLSPDSVMLPDSLGGPGLEGAGPPPEAGEDGRLDLRRDTRADPRLDPRLDTRSDPRLDTRPDLRRGSDEDTRDASAGRVIDLQE